MALKYHRRVIHISAFDSPNVRLAQAEIDVGLTPSLRELVPGVIGWEELEKRLATWDEVRKCIGIYGRFYKGAQLLLYPPTWLNRANQVAASLRTKYGGNGKHRRAKGIGIDPGEGMANTSYSAVDEYGLIELHSIKTADTDPVVREAIAFGNRHGMDSRNRDEGGWHKMIFDRGGGGKQHADRMRAQGYPVRTVAFGETVVLDPKRGLRMIEEKVENREERYTYRNRRAQMAHELSLLLDESVNQEGWGIPGPECGPQYAELRRQMAPIPKLLDEEGRYWMLPKNKKDPDSKVKTLVELLGASPDELDATMLAVFAMLHEERPAVAGVVA